MGKVGTCETHMGGMFDLSMLSGSLGWELPTRTLAKSGPYQARSTNSDYFKNRHFIPVILSMK